MRGEQPDTPAVNVVWTTTGLRSSTTGGHEDAVGGSVRHVGPFSARLNGWNCKRDDNPPASACPGTGVPPSTSRHETGGEHPPFVLATGLSHT